MNITEALELVAEQESALVFENFDEALALELGLAATALAKQKGKSIFVNVSRGLNTLFEHSMVGTSPANADFGLRKRAVVNLMNFSSITFWLHNQNGFDFKAFMNLPERDFGSYGGSFPIRVKNAGVIGSLTISGLSDIDDHNFVIELLNSMLRQDSEFLKELD